MCLSIVKRTKIVYRKTIRCFMCPTWCHEQCLYSLLLHVIVYIESMLMRIIYSRCWRMLLRYFHLCFRRMKKNRFHTYCIIKLDRLPVLRTLYKSIGSVIIPKTHFSNSRCRRFGVLLFAAFCSQSVAAMITVLAAHVVAGDWSTVTCVMPLFDGELACSFNRHLRETRSSQ